MANPYFNPMGANPFLQYPYQTQTEQHQAFSPQGVIVQWVMGKAAAKAFYVPPGRTAFLFDTEKAIFYEKSSDKNGVPMPMRVHPYSEISDAEDDINTAESTIDMAQYVKRDEIDCYIQEAIKKIMNQAEVKKDE